ncbi:MAG: glutathione S-transferase [Acidobacteriota bacterium]
MHYYNSIGPNPRVVNMFLHEKGVELPTTQIDLMGGENRQDKYLSEVSPAGQCPALALDGGQVLTEITAICEYLEEKNPTPVLIGSTPEERGETRMWTRRVDLGVCEPLANGFRFSQGFELFKDRLLCRPEAADGLKAMAQDRLQWVDTQLEGKEYLAGDRFSLADILLYAFLDFGAQVGQPLAEGNANVNAWFERVGSRQSAQATAG